MSITMTQPIRNVLCVYIPLIYTFPPDTTTGRDHYRVKVDVYDDSDDSVIGTKWITTLNSAGAFQTDISNILQTLLDVDMPNGTETTIYSTTNSCKKYYLKAQEYWDDSNGILTLQGTAITSNTKSCIASTEYPEESAGVSKGLLTDMPILIRGGYGQSAFITTETTGIYVKVTRYNGSTEIDSINLTLATGDSIDGLVLIPLNDKIYTAATTSIKIGVYDSTDVLLSNEKTLSIVDRCTDAKIIQFKNKYGQVDFYGFDSYTHEDNISRTAVLNDLINFDGYINITKYYKLFGRYENSTVMNWLRQLNMSRYLYLDSERIKVTTTKQVVISDELTALQLEIILQNEYTN